VLLKTFGWQPFWRNLAVARDDEYPDFYHDHGLSDLAAAGAAAAGEP
jgi:hypothetical protein